MGISAVFAVLNHYRLVISCILMMRQKHIWSSLSKNIRKERGTHETNHHFSTGSQQRASVTD